MKTKIVSILIYLSLISVVCFADVLGSSSRQLLMIVPRLTKSGQFGSKLIGTDSSVNIVLYNDTLKSFISVANQLRSERNASYILSFLESRKADIILKDFQVNGNVLMSLGSSENCVQVGNERYIYSIVLVVVTMEYICICCKRMFWH